VILLRRLLPVLAGLWLTACAGAVAVSPMAGPAESGWSPAPAAVRPVGLGLPGGARLAQGVRFAGGVELVAGADSPLHGLSDLKLLDATEFVSITDAGDLVRGRLVLGPDGSLSGLEALRVRRLTDLDGRPIVDKAMGDAEGLLLTASGELFVSFEREHRIWNYGSLDALAARPTPVRHPDAVFGLNEGMEGISVAPDGGWRVTGEAGGVWDCSPARCVVISAPPEPPLAVSDYRITGLDRDPSGDGWFVVQRAYTPPVDARARVRRMARDGGLGPVLVALRLPGTTDNFEGIAAIARDGATRLYILSDDNSNTAQRTLLLAFDVRSVR
jgi:hypothetical protein